MAFENSTDYAPGVSTKKQKNRMAGSEEFKEELSKAQRHERARERIANDPERATARLEAVDREQFDLEGYSDKDIIMAFQGGTFDHNDYARLTGEKGDGGDDGNDGGNGGDDNSNPSPKPTPSPSPDPDKPGDQIINPIIPNPYDGGGDMTQNINQNNDINNTVSGNNNQIVNNQDNSIVQSRGFSGGNYGSSWKDAWMKNYFA